MQLQQQTRMCNCCLLKCAVCADPAASPWHAVLQACSITPLVKNAEALVRASRRVLGDGFTFGLMRHTFMKQFCAGWQGEGQGKHFGTNVSPSLTTEHQYKYTW